MQLTTLFILLMQMHCQSGDAISVQQLCYQQDSVVVEIASEVKKPIVLKMDTTGYIKPEKDQKNYRQLVKLNGKGVITAYGKVQRVATKDHEGTIAADPKHKILTPGRKVYIEGYGYGIVEDRGGSIKKNRLDLFMGNGKAGYQLAKIWGRKKDTLVYVL